MNNEINQSHRFEEKINSIHSSFLSALDNCLITFCLFLHFKQNKSLPTFTHSVLIDKHS